MKDKMLLSTIGVVVIWVLLSSASPMYAQDKGLRIAFNIPLSGELSSYGVPIQEGVQMAVDDQALEGSVEPPLSFDWQDNKSQARESVLIFQQQLLKRPDIYVTGVKPQFMAIRNELEKEGIPSFVWIFDVSIKNKMNSNFRTWVNFKVETPLFLEYSKNINAKKVAIVYVQLPHTDLQYNEGIIPGLKAQGIKEILVQPYQMDKNDFRDYAARIRSFNPDLMILSGYQGHFVPLLKSLRVLNLIKEGNTIATYDLLDAAPLLAKHEVEGILVSAPRFVTRADNNNIKSWAARFRGKYKKDPLYTHAYAYDMGLIFVRAAAQVGNSVDREVLLKVLKHTDIQGITGPLRFDDEGDLKSQVELGVFRSGKAVPY